DQPPGRDAAVGFAHEPPDRIPVGPPVEAYPDPTARPDIGRYEVAAWIGIYQRLLRTERHGQPHTHVFGAVMMVVELSEQLALNAECRLTPGDLFGRLGEGEAEGAQPLEWFRIRAARALDLRSSWRPLHPALTASRRGSAASGARITGSGA